MKTNTTDEQIKAVWVEYPVGNRSFGGGGWSRNAKYRPAPERREIITRDVIFTTGKSVIVDGQRKLKVNLYNASTGAIIRADYPTSGLTEFGLTIRQAAARARVAAKKSAAAKIVAEKAAADETARRQEILANLPQDVAGWIAAGAIHPAPSAVLAAKQASGLSWTEFTMTPVRNNI